MPGEWKQILAKTPAMVFILCPPAKVVVEQLEGLMSRKVLREIGAQLHTLQSAPSTPTWRAPPCRARGAQAPHPLSPWLLV